MKHTKKMYVVVNASGEPVWNTIRRDEDGSKRACDEYWGYYDSLGYTVQPVTVTIELP